jgi:hypothetical protein
MPNLIQYMDSIGFGAPGAVAETSNPVMSAALLLADTDLGVFVVKQTDGEYFKAQSAVPTTEDEVLRAHGVVARNIATVLTADGQYEEGFMAPVLENGSIWVHVEDAVSLGDPAYVRYEANGALTRLGAVRATADDGCALKPNCRFVSSTEGEGIAILRINLP